MIQQLVQILSRHHGISNLDPVEGTWRLNEDGRSVGVHIPPRLLHEYLAQLDDESIPGLSQASPEARDGRRLKYISLLIEELFESDLDESLQEICLRRNQEGMIVVDRRNGPPQRSVLPATAQGGSWSSSPPPPEVRADGEPESR